MNNAQKQIDAVCGYGSEDNAKYAVLSEVLKESLFNKEASPATILLRLRDKCLHEEDFLRATCLVTSYFIMDMIQKYFGNINDMKEDNGKTERG
jgi:hypothetical protein